jgi:AcrR family transcriptional regulator
MARSRAPDYAGKQKSILRQAATLFARFGYVGSSISMIAEACGVSKALLYHYYPDKDAILFGILHGHLETLIAAVEEASTGGDAKDRLYSISAALLDCYRDAGAEHRIHIASLKLLPPEKQETLRGMERKLVGVFAEAISAAVPGIGHGPLLKPLTMSLFGMLNWHYLWFREGGALSRDDYARLASALITAGGAHASEALSPAAGGVLPGTAPSRSAGTALNAREHAPLAQRRQKPARFS